MTRKAITMPVHDVTSNDTAAMMAATPVASISLQVKERLEREARAREWMRAHELRLLAQLGQPD